MCKSAPYIFTDGIYYTYGKQKVYSNNYSVKLPFNTLINNVGTHPNAVYFRLYCTCIIGQGNVFSGMLYFSECSWIVPILLNRD